MSQWINIDKLGTVGATPDKSPPHREPPALDTGMNIRAVGPNLANAGGFSLVAGLPTAPVGPVYVTQFMSEAIMLPDPEARVSQFMVETVTTETPEARVTQFLIETIVLE